MNKKEQYSVDSCSIQINCIFSGQQGLKQLLSSLTLRIFEQINLPFNQVCDKKQALQEQNALSCFETLAWCRCQHKSTIMIA